MASQTVPLNGHLRIRAWEKQPDGSEKLIKDSLIKNLIVDVGKDTIMKRLGNMSGGGYITKIGVGDNTTAAAVGQTDLQASSNKVWIDILTANRIFATPTLYLSVDFGYSQANFTWNELGLRDAQSSPALWARQIDASPLVKTSSKRAIVEWQLTI